jgi:chromosome segregation ATPase
LVKNGCNTATIKITLRNQGPEAFRHEEYGDFIIVERRIQKEGGGGYTLRASDGRKVSSTRDELNDILEQFNIQVDNPCNVLMQDASKLFLAGNKPEKKYELFLKATQLEQMHNDLEETGKNISLGEMALASKEDALPAMEEKMKELEAKVQALQLLETQRKKARKMRSNLAWSHVRVRENELESAESELTKIEEQETKLADAKAQKEQQLLAAKAEQTQLTAHLSEMRTATRELDAAQFQFQSDMRTVQTGAAKFDAEIETRKAEQNRLKQRINTKRAKIRELQAQSRGGDQEAAFRKKLALAEKKRAESEKLSTEHNDAMQRRPVLEEEANQLEEKVRSADSQARRVNDEVTKLSAQEKRLASASKDRTAAFGYDVPRILGILRANEKRFSSPPIGPIGLYVTLLDDKWTQFVDAELGKTLDKFLVANSGDLKLFQDLMRKNQIKSPQILVTRFADKPYELRPQNLPSSQFKTLLQIIKIDQPTCFNSIIDMHSPERYLLFDTYDEAKSVMFPQSPQNAKKAYALDTHTGLTVHYGSEVTSGIKRTNAPRLQADVTAALEETRAVLHARSQELQPLHQQAQQLKQRLQQVSKELKQVVDKVNSAPGIIDRLNSEIEELEKPPEVEPDRAEEINQVEAGIPDLESKVAEEQLGIDAILEKKKEHLKGIEPIEAQLDELHQKRAEMEKAIDQGSTQLDSIGKAIHTLAERLPQFEQALEKLKGAKIVAGEKCKELRQTVEEYVTKAQMLSPRPSEEEIMDTPEQIEKKIVSFERLIEEQQKAGGLSHEVIGEYQDAKASIDALRQAIDDTRSALQQAHTMLKERARRWVQFRKGISSRARALFISYLSYRNFEGQLKFDHKASTLNIEINPSRATGGGSRDTTTLSGGERSFSTVALLLALWDMMESPFRAMDEFDVFMDAVNRRLSMEMLLEAASEKRHRQYIFLTPQQLQGVQLDEFTKVIRMKPVERNQRTIDEMIGRGEGNDE